MENKQTAVEWLESQLEQQAMINVYTFEDQLFCRKLIKKAKEMEKEQEQLSRKESYNEGWLEATQYIFKKYKQQEHEDRN